MFRKAYFLPFLIAALIIIPQSTDARLSGANLRMGCVKPENHGERTVGFGFGVSPMAMEDDFGLDVNIFYWQLPIWTHSLQLKYPIHPYEEKHTDFAIKFQGKAFLLSRTVRPYLGVGLGFSIWRSWLSESGG